MSDSQITNGETARDLVSAWHNGLANPGALSVDDLKRLDAAIERRRSVDAEFSADLETALVNSGYRREARAVRALLRHHVEASLSANQKDDKGAVPMPLGITEWSTVEAVERIITERDNAVKAMNETSRWWRERMEGLRDALGAIAAVVCERLDAGMKKDCSTAGLMGRCAPCIARRALTADAAAEKGTP